VATPCCSSSVRHHLGRVVDLHTVVLAVQVRLDIHEGVERTAPCPGSSDSAATRSARGQNSRALGELSQHVVHALLRAVERRPRPRIG